MTEVLLLQTARAEADATETEGTALIMSGSDLCGTTRAFSSDE